MSAPFVVAIDGPAGSGKSTVGSAVAHSLDFACLDTGSAYRALAWVVLDRGIVPGHDDAVAGMIDRGIDVEIGTDPTHASVSVSTASGARIDITAAIRDPRITSAVSTVARVPTVRKALNSLFRDIIRLSVKSGIVVEGRDITTVVVPEADVRILLTASEEVRAGRRSAETPNQLASETREQLRSRDNADSRVSNFTNLRDGVITIDTTTLDRDQTVATVIDVVTSETSGITHEP